jgi:hypothetical protein
MRKQNILLIPDPGPGVKIAPDPESRIRIHNTVQPRSASKKRIIASVLEQKEISHNYIILPNLLNVLKILSVHVTKKSK